MRIFRVEFPDEDRKGPYSGPVGCGWQAMGDSADGFSHPCPQEDGIGFEMSCKHYCGFASLDAFKAWFRNPEILWRNGYVLRVYEVPDDDVILGRKQLAFKRERAVLVEEMETIHAP